MVDDQTTALEPVRRGDARRTAIHRAAIEQFSERGLSATSMANIAAAAGLSRPALYQYFRDKSDIFASAFVDLFDNHVDAAIEALDQPGSTSERIDRFLQRYDGDLWERMAASPHTDEMIGAKNEEISAAISAIVDRLWAGMATHLQDAAPGRSASMANKRADWLQLLRLSPVGFRSDQPTVEVYRGRLTALARTVASDIDSCVAGP